MKMSSPLLTRATAAVLAAAAAAWSVRDYRRWRALGIGGIPANPIGWSIVSVMRLLVRETRSTELYSALPNEDPASYLGPLPQRQGTRPALGSHPVPHRQIEIGHAERREAPAVRTALAESVVRNSDTVHFARSHFERHGDAVTLRQLDGAAPWVVAARGEIAHVHESDGSAHVILSPADAARVIESGWGERHPLCGVPVLGIPVTYIMLYVPHNDIEVGVFRQVLQAAIDHMTVREEDVAAARPPATLRIADPAEALTLARARIEGRDEVVLITSYNDGEARGVVVPQAAEAAPWDAVAAFTMSGYDGLRRLLAGEVTEVTVPVDSLQMPLLTDENHVAMGTNYPEHGKETSVTSAFLFPKIVQPTGPRGRLEVGPGLLDYEVELALVPLGQVRDGDRPEHMGLLLTNDFTDREVLLTRFDPRNITSSVGFPEAKSEPGFLPVGDLLVIPADWRRFYRTLTIELLVDDRVRQIGRPRDMIWDADEILEQVTNAAGREWRVHGRPVPITARPGVIDPRTIILTGTPDGVIFRPPTRGQIARGIVRWLLGGFKGTPIQAAVAVSIAAAHRTGIYLHAGQRVESRADLLGRIVVDLDRPRSGSGRGA